MYETVRDVLEMFPMLRKMAIPQLLSVPLLTVLYGNDCLLLSYLAMNLTYAFTMKYFNLKIQLRNCTTTGVPLSFMDLADFLEREAYFAYSTLLVDFQLEKYE
jgi:hypothetical protein